jgi:hypothetical protein
MAFYNLRRAIPLTFIVCVVLGLRSNDCLRKFWFTDIFVIFWCYLIFYVGYLPFAPLKTYNLFSDYSYGMYIYTCPFEQVSVALCKSISPLGLIAISFPLTLAFAIVSS